MSARSFTARYTGGLCALCDGIVRVGQEVRYDMFDSLVHVVCPPDPTALARTVCPRCFIELPVSGVCDDCDG